MAATALASASGADRALSGETSAPPDPADSGDDPASPIHPSEAAFRTWRVGTAVNNVRHDAASLLNPV